ncbi:hypothetical protein Aperf_G00000009663 [Anoplocephala perfoliata]
MHRIPGLDDLIEENGYVKNRYLTCHNRLVVTLWGSFQKAIADLTQLYKDKLDNHCDRNCLVQTLNRITHFHSSLFSNLCYSCLVSQKVLQLAEIFGNGLGSECGRLLIRDGIVSSSLTITPNDVYAYVLLPFHPERATKRRKRLCSKYCKKCNKLKRPRNFKRQRFIPKPLAMDNEIPLLPSSNCYDFSSAPRDLLGNFTVSMEQFPAPISSTLFYMQSPNEDLGQISFHQNVPGHRSKRKRRLSEMSDNHDYGLIDSMSKVCLHPKSKVPRRNPFIDDHQ